METFFKSVVASNLYAEGLKEVTVIVERGRAKKKRFEKSMEVAKDDLRVEGFPAEYVGWKPCNEGEGFVFRVVAGWNGKVDCGENVFGDGQVEVYLRVPPLEDEVIEEGLEFSVAGCAEAGV